ncbi:hypothetical protein [Paucisalibacillus globulus]|uniref:hypothetical protein n=1 Tax=Paucisalibacillus globulus TaxID=351095 RepID=UPI000BB6EC9C|nr:hypothetical protein [Paucisalibacillus globulus]
MIDDLKVVTLQEVRKNDFDYITSSHIFDKLYYSLDFRKPGPYDTTNRKLGCMIGVIGNFDVEQFGVLPRTAFPDRTLFSDINIDGITFKIVCFHSLTGVGYKKTKPAQFTGVAEYLHFHKEVPTICCFDANETEVDHYDMDNVQLFKQNGDRGVGASLILSNRPVHRMKDTYRTWFDKNKEILDVIKAKQDSVQDEKELKYTPLTASHIINGKFPKRYDYIFSSEEFKVKNVEYRMEDSLKAGSDHAMVVTDLQLDYSMLLPRLKM